MGEEQKYKESQFSKVEMEEEPRTAFKTIKDQNLPGFCFKKRTADLFLIGVARAYINNVLPKMLTKDDKKKADAFNIAPEEKGAKTRSLVDREEFWNLFRVIAYAHNIHQAGNDKNSDKWKTSHHVITDGQHCTKIAEEFFKGGWTSPTDDSFKHLIGSEIPDDYIIQELQPYFDIEEEDDAND